MSGQVSSNAELCSNCGIPMTVIPNPSPEMLRSTDGFEMLEEFIAKFITDFNSNDMQMAFCNDCGSSALLGPEVVFSGTIVDSSE